MANVSPTKVMVRFDKKLTRPSTKLRKPKFIKHAIWQYIKFSILPFEKKIPKNLYDQPKNIKNVVHS